VNLFAIIGKAPQAVVHARTIAIHVRALLALFKDEIAEFTAVEQRAVAAGEHPDDAAIAAVRTVAGVKLRDGALTPQEEMGLDHMSGPS
jgi:hypothetical protein